VRRPGLQALHADAYLFRSPAAKRETRLTAAFLLPDAFATGVVRAYLFPLQPLDRKRWEALLVVGFPVPLDSAVEGETQREFGVVLRDKPAIRHVFNRSVTLRPKGPRVSASPTVTFVERVQLAPGSYELTAVMSDPEATQPHSAHVKVELPPIPRDGLFLVQPVLGRPAGDDLVIHAASAEAAHRKGKKSKAAKADPPTPDRVGSAESFQPLLVTQVDRPQDLTVLTSACLVGSGELAGASIARLLRDATGQEHGNLPPQALALGREGKDDEGKVRCQSLVDVLPRGALPPGDYSFDAVVEPVPQSKQAALRAALKFAVGAAK
jgi:hypothetical protein